MSVIRITIPWYMSIEGKLHVSVYLPINVYATFCIVTIIELIHNVRCK